MEYTLQNAYSRVTSANSLYMNSRARWQFLLESYLGGDDYRRGQHLTRYNTETLAEYQARIATTPLDNQCRSIVREWTKDAITTYQLNNLKQEITHTIVETNELGKIPAIISYATRSPVRGIGASLITDIADYQQQIYNFTSEIDQSIRLNGHPTLVKTPSVEASAGAGAIALMPDDMDPALKPYLLNVATDIGSIYSAIGDCVNAIDKMANTGAVRATATNTQSGVSMETEFQLLNAKLSEFADGLELTEEQIWILFAEYEGTVWDGLIQYPNAFNIRDMANEYRNLQVAKSAATGSEVTALIDLRLRELMEDPRFVHTDDAPADSKEIQQHIDILNSTTAQPAQPAQPTTAPSQPAAGLRPRYNIQLGTQTNG